MQIAILKEIRKGEHRVAATPESVKKFIALGCKVNVETGAGDGSKLPDELYSTAGATITKDAAATLHGADLLLKVQSPTDDEIKLMPAGINLISLMNPLDDKGIAAKLAQQKINGFALEFIPRISRAQSMDVLSSQSNLAGYRAVIEAAIEYGRAFPMMMTAAGTVAPARALILGVGVAGLQAIATAKRLGAIVSAFDVRKAAKEQAMSLGAKFIEVEGDEDAETAGGYAKESSNDYKKLQAAKIHETLLKQDIVITTALIPGKKAPVLITKDMVKDMRPGSVIVDLAAGAGGNCEYSKPDQIINKYDVKIIGFTNIPSHIASDASSLLARNIYNLVELMFDKEAKKLTINLEDEIIKSIMLTENGKVIHDLMK